MLTKDFIILLSYIFTNFSHTLLLHLFQPLFASVANSLTVNHHHCPHYGYRRCPNCPAISSLSSSLPQSVVTFKSTVAVSYYFQSLSPINCRPCLPLSLLAIVSGCIYVYVYIYAIYILY